jgi:hypothetical protein
MTNAHNGPPDKNFSLTSEIKKRQMQELISAIQAKQNTATELVTPQATDGKTVPVDAAIESRANAVSTKSAETPERNSRVLSRYRTFAAVLCILGVLALLILILPKNVPTPEVIAPPSLFPTTRAAAVIQRLAQAGVPILTMDDLQAFPPAGMKSDFWKAEQVIQFTVRIKRQNGTFLVISYTDPSALENDIPKMAQLAPYKDWPMTRAANMLFYINPTMPDNIKTEVLNYFAEVVQVSVPAPLAPQAAQ